MKILFGIYFSMLPPLSKLPDILVSFIFIYEPLDDAHRNWKNDNPCSLSKLHCQCLPIESIRRAVQSVFRFFPHILRSALFIGVVLFKKHTRHLPMVFHQYYLNMHHVCSLRVLMSTRRNEIYTDIGFSLNFESSQSQELL